MNELRELMRENVGEPPPDHLDLAAVVDAGRCRVRARRRLVTGGAALAVAAVVVTGALLSPMGGTPSSRSGSDAAGSGPPAAASATRRGLGRTSETAARRHRVYGAGEGAAPDVPIGRAVAGRATGPGFG